MLKSLILAFSTIVFFTSYSQLTLLSDDFESGGGTWTSSGDLLPNYWIYNSCAGNGPTLAGSGAMYITPGGAVAGCGATGAEQYAYENAPIGTLSAITSAQIDAGCVTSLQVDFDYKIDGNLAEDYAELVYSDDNGVSWIPVGAALPMSSTWTSTSITLPVLLEGTIFDLGFRYTYNDVTISGSPLAVDNISVQGIDIVPPTIVCPLVTPLYMANSCDGSIIDYTSSALVADICIGTITVSQTPAPGTVVDITSTPMIILTATDPSGNQSQCQFTQTIFDTIPPTITCPGTQSVSLDAVCSALVADYTSLAISGDNCSGFSGVTITQSPPASSVIGADATIILTAEDGYLNTSSCSFTLQAIDAISPTITCPSPVTANTNVACDYTLIDYSSVAVANDNCTPSVSLLYSQNPVASTLLPLGTTSVTLFAEDAQGNIGSCIFDITVEDLVDPTIGICAANQNVIVDNNCQGVLGDYTSLISPTDNCSTIGNLSITQSPIFGTSISTTTIVTLTVTDENGNSTNCQFSAILSDTTSPIPACPVDFELAINSSCEYVIPDITGAVVGTDNCSTLGNMIVNQSPTAGSTQNGITPILITLIDEQGNIGTCITTATPIDTDPPTITCPANQAGNLGLVCDYILPNYASISSVLDNCTSYSIEQTPPVGTVVNPGVNTITLTVTDAGGNVDQCSFSLTLSENEAPTITCPADISTCDPNIIYSDPTFNDNCLAAMSQTDLTGLSSGMVFPIGITTLEYTAADSSGNTQTCTFNVEVLDFPSPANIVEDTLWLCNQNTTLVNADVITSGIGSWTVISGQGSFNNAAQNSTGVNNIGFGENVYLWTVSSTLCGSDSDTLIVINSQEDLPASTQDTIYACNDGSVILQSNVPLFGIGTWSTDMGGVIADINSSNTTSSLINSGWNQFIWTISNGSCPVNADTLHVFSSLKPEIVTADTAICLEDNFINMVGPIPVGGQNVDWSVLSGGADLIFDILNPPTATATDMALGVNLFVFSISHPSCPSLSDTLEVITSLCDGFDPYIPTVITPNFDGKNDLFHIDFLEKVYPECHVVIFNRWGSIVYESDGYDDPWDGTFKGESLPMGTYFYKIELNDPEGTVYNGDISIIH